MAGGAHSKSSSRSGAGVGDFVNNEILGAGLGNVRTELFRQIAEAMNTGGVGARIPQIQQAVSQQRQALGQAMTGTQNQLGRSGLAGTPFGQRILAEQRQLGNAGIASIPTQVAAELSSQAPQLTQGLLTAALGALASVSKSKSESHSSTFLGG